MSKSVQARKKLDFRWRRRGKEVRKVDGWGLCVVKNVRKWGRRPRRKRKVDKIGGDEAGQKKIFEFKIRRRNNGCYRCGGRIKRKIGIIWIRIIIILDSFKKRGQRPYGAG